MKKSAIAVWSTAFILLVVMNTHAVTWDVDRPFHSTPAGTYVIPPLINGGFHWYNTTPIYTNDNRGIGNSSSDIDQAASDTTTENFGSHPVQMIYQATGSGGVLPNGLYNSAFAEITYDLDTNSGVSFGHQRIVTDTFRNFIPGGTGMITVSANIEGSMDWVEYNYDWMSDSAPNPFDWHSGFRIAGTVEILSFSVSGGLVDLIDPLILNNGTLSGTIYFYPVVHPDIYYVLHVSLRIDTYLENMDNFTGGQLKQLKDEIFKIGNSESEPVKLIATVSQEEHLQCKGDFDEDSDVDGKNLAEFTMNDMGITLKRFAVEFGKIDCE